MRSLLVALVLVLSLGCSLAQAQPSPQQPGCRIELVGAPTLTWREAAAWLPSTSDPGTDCSELYVRVDEHGADVTFVGRDGQRAQRRLSKPDELAPLLQALRAAAPDSAVAVVAEASAARADAKPALATWALLGKALLGVRVGQDALLSPVLATALLTRYRAWELGLGLAWEAKYYPLRTPRLLRTAAAVTPALSAAFRQPVKKATLLLGVHLSLGVVLFKVVESSLTVTDVVPLTETRHTAYELRPGTFVGVSFPRAARVRMRAELAFDFVAWSEGENHNGNTFGPSATGGSSTTAAFFPYNITPSWALSAMLGIEFGGP